MAKFFYTRLCRISDKLSISRDLQKNINFTDREMGAYAMIASKIEGFQLQIFDVQLYLSLRAGFFSADPQAGNCLIQPDGTIGMIDFGAAPTTRFGLILRNLEASLHGKIWI